MAGSIVFGLAGLIVTAGLYVSARRNPRWLEASQRHRHRIVLGVTAASFASAVGAAVAVGVLQ